MSSLAWVDFDEADRQRAERIMALFQERETRDELGLGATRDSIADHLPPGTSTMQTRLRYMLFVPWLICGLDRRELSEREARAEARAIETRMAEALKTGGETVGIIGRDVGARRPARTVTAMRVVCRTPGHPARRRPITEAVARRSPSWVFLFNQTKNHLGRIR